MRLDTAEKRLAARYIPKDSKEIRFDAVNAVVYAQQTPRGIHALAYRGTAAHPDWNYSFKTSDRFEEYTTQWAYSLSEYQNRKAAYRSERVNFKHTLQVGEVVTYSWGYDQTNLEFFEIVARTEKTVTLRPIGGNCIEASGPGGNRFVPMRTKYLGPALNPKPVRPGNYITMPHGCAHKWSGRPCYETDSMFGH